MPFLAAGPDITPIQDLITTWIHIGQALVGSIGALASISLCSVNTAVVAYLRAAELLCRG